MADKQIVTKKTAVKPAATSAATPATPPIAKKTETKKAVEQSANPTPSSPATKPSKPAATRSAAPEAAAATSNVAAETGGAKKAKATRTQATKPKPQTSREEKPMSLQDLANVTPEQRLDMIREAAYYKAEKRDFAEGHEADDWNEAESEIDDLLAKARKIYGG